MYIWQEWDWPCFTWDDDLVNPFKTQVWEAAVRLDGRLGLLDEAGRDAFRLSILEDEVIASSLIEGVRLDRKDAYAGPASIVQDAQDHHDRPLTKTRLLGWHHQLFPDGISEGRRIRTGAWRQGPVYVVSGHMGMEVIHFEAPPAKVVDEEIDRFLEFVNGSDVDPLVKASIAHLWFVTIHPFEDGNGRITRAVTSYILAKAGGVCYSPSSAILSERKSYYDALEWAERGTMDISAFIVYFLKTLHKAVDSAAAKLERMRYRDTIRSLPLNGRQVKMIEMLLEGFKGKLTAEKWAKITKCSHSTALRDINGLIGMGVLVDDGGRTRNTGYLLKAMEYAKDS